MGTRIKTSKAKPKSGCRNKAVAVVVLAATLFGLLAVSACDWFGDAETNETCKITARDTTSLTTRCTDSSGVETSNSGRKDVPSDLYPGCQIDTFWPGCKES